jgi:hypothetical protein
MSDKVAYEPHPVSPERKAELRAQGFKIIDVRFKPKEKTPKPKRGRPPKSEAIDGKETL